jgi:hypothetical protein
MVTGLLFVIIGLVILVYPQVLVVMISAALVLTGLGMMGISWQFRRLRRQSESRFVNWIIRY